MNEPLISRWTVGAVLQWTAGYFERRGIDSPRFTAEILLSHSLGLRRLDLYLGYDRPLDDAERSLFRELVRRRVSREPLAYITGKKAFWNLDLEVSSDVLIPRPDTERLIEVVLDEIKSSVSAGQYVRFADLGTGSGAVALSLLSEISGSYAIATDLSMNALAVAKKNAFQNGFSDRVSFLCSDWFSALSTTRTTQVFDFIVSNPPYINKGVICSLEPEVRAFEPVMALDGGDDGLDCIRIIAGNAYHYLKNGGFVTMEAGYDQGAAVVNLFETTGLYRDIKLVRDYGGNDRVIFARKKDF